MERYTGYKYSRMGEEIYIIKLCCFNEFANPLYKELAIDFFTTDCIVEEIRNVNTGKRAKWINGAAWFPFRYEEGQRITGTSVYYCKTRAALFACYLCKDSAGRITDRLSDTFGFCKNVYPGLSYIANSIIKNADSSESLFEELNRFFLHAERKLFKDENRTVDEILHVDPLTWEKVPSELKIDGLSQEETEIAWMKFRNLHSSRHPARSGAGS